MSAELLPCPFCGSRNLITSHGWQVLCVECGAHGPPVTLATGGGTRLEKLTRMWNRRPIIAATRAEDHAAGKLEGYRKGLAAAMTIALENEVCHVCGCELLAPAGKPYCEDTCHSRSDPAEGEDYDIYHGNYIPTSERICALLTTDVKGSDGNG